MSNLRIDTENRLVEYIGVVPSAELEEMVNNCNKLSDKYEWKYFGDEEKCVSLKSKNELTDEILSDMIEWVSIIISASVVTTASVYYSDCIKKNIEPEFEYYNPYKTEVFMVELGSDISDELSDECFNQRKTDIPLDRFFEKGSSTFNLALSFCKDEADGAVKEHFQRDFRVLTIKYDSGKVAIRSASGFLLPSGSDDEWMCIRDMFEVLESVSNTASVAQIQFLGIVPPDDVIDEIMDIFEGKISLISVDVEGFLTVPRGSEDFYKTGSVDDYMSGAADNLLGKKKTPKFLS